MAVGGLISGMLIESHCFLLKEALLGLLGSVTVYSLSTDGNCRHSPPPQYLQNNTLGQGL